MSEYVQVLRDFLFCYYVILPPELNDTIVAETKTEK